MQAVAVGSDHSMVLMIDGSVWSTGSNMHGQLGDGLTVDSRAGHFYRRALHGLVLLGGRRNWPRGTICFEM